MHYEPTFDYGPISEFLAELQATQVMPVGAFGKMFTILDEMRAARAAPAQIAVAEKISVALHRLELARRRRDAETEESLRGQLEILSQDWAELCSSSSDPRTVPMAA